MLHVRYAYVNHKKAPFLFSQTLTTFNKSFAVAFSDELPKEMKQDLPPHVKSVAALPCEN